MIEKFASNSTDEYRGVIFFSKNFYIERSSIVWNLMGIGEIVQRK